MATVLRNEDARVCAAAPELLNAAYGFYDEMDGRGEGRHFLWLLGLIAKAEGVDVSEIMKRQETWSELDPEELKDVRRWGTQ